LKENLLDESPVFEQSNEKKENSDEMYVPMISK
jgi:hypothetical protein